MYNHLLDTFIKVADAGSFNKAAENNLSRHFNLIWKLILLMIIF